MSLDSAAIGSITSLGPGGQPARVLARSPAGEDAAGNPLVRLTLRSETAKGGEDGVRQGDDPREAAALNRLRARDAQVRAEENAHSAAAGDLAGPTQLEMQRGPDGRLYAVGGSVGIQARVLSGSPEELRRLGQRLTGAAAAAINPSGADQAVARSGDALKAYGNAEALRESAEVRKPGLDLAV